MPTKSKARKGNKPMPTNKKQSKAKKLLNWLKPTSPAKGALLFAIVFAVIGGSYTAYKSFAASNSIVKYHNDIQGYPTYAAAIYPTREIDNLSSKGGTTVWKLGNQMVVVANILVPFSSNGPFNFCVTAKSSTSYALYDIGGSWNDGFKHSDVRASFPTNSYAKICSRNNLVQFASEPKFQLRAINSTNSTLWVSNMSLEW